MRSAVRVGHDVDAAEYLRGFLTRWAFSPLQGMRLRDWIQVIAANRARVHPLYWLRALITTGSAAATSVQARREQRHYSTALENAAGPPPIFVLGHYRSGTTHLHNLLSVDPRFSFLNNFQATFPRTFLTMEDSVVRRIGATLAPRERPHDGVRLDLEVPTEDELALCTVTAGLSPHMAWHFPARAPAYERYLTFRDADVEERSRWKTALRLVVRKLHYRYPSRRPILKSPCHTARVALILEAFPDALFVHIHRHPYEVFRSTRHMELKIRPLFQFQRADLDDLDLQIIRRYRTMYDAYLEDRQRIPAGRLVELPYRQLVQSPLEALEAVYDRLGLADAGPIMPAWQRYLESVSGYRNNRHRPLTGSLRRELRSAWRSAFETWGYPA